MASELHQTSYDDEPTKLPNQLIKNITNNYNQERKLGSAGFGTVYKGIHENGEEIAVKILRNLSGIDWKEFQKQVQNLRRLQHQNVVQLLGFCNESENVVAHYNGQQVTLQKMYAMFCFEYLHSGSLTKHISDEHSGLDWHTRYKIIKGTCEGLKYLREGLESPIWHLDLKTNNILLDGNMLPKISDIGFSRLFGDGNMRCTINSMCTVGYLPPEFIEHGIVANEFDIYSLGVIITKIMSGLQGFSSIADITKKQGFIDHVHGNWRKRLRETLNPNLLEVYCNQVKRCIEIALQCMKRNRYERPSVRHILSELNFTETIIVDLEMQIEQGVLKDGHVIAVKMLRYMPGIAENQFKTEFEHLKRLQHQNIVKLVGFCDEEEEVLVSLEEKTIHAIQIHRALCLEFVANGGLGKFISNQYIGLDWSSRFKIIKGICEGLKYLHEVRVTHLDLKPDNILLDEEMVPKIADFGLSRLIGEDNTKMTLSPLGTLGYLPPEFITKQVISLKYDIFSLGVIIKKIVAGIFDYSNISCMDDLECIDHVHQNWRKRLQDIPMYPSLHEDCKQVRACIEIAINCMETDPRRRPTMMDIVHQLNNVDTIKIDSLGERTDMPDQESECENLERILADTSAEPTKLSYALIRSITESFSHEIGRGGFGVVYMGILANGVVAVKKLVSVQGFSDELFADEIKLLMMAKHNNIVRFLGYCSDTKEELLELHGRYIMAEVPQRFLCYEYVPNGSLQHYLTEKSHVDEWQFRYNIIKGICQGLHYLHKEHVHHLDLKPENVMLDAHMEPKLMDFGLSRCFDEGQSRIRTKFIHGSPVYLAPKTTENGEISFKSDVFSLGVIIMKLLRGHVTHDIKDWDKFLDVASPQMKICVEIVQACVDVDPYNRPTLGKILRLLNASESMTQEVSPVIQESRVIGPAYSLYQLNIHPLELSFPFEPKKSISCLLQLDNNGDDRVAFMLLTKRPRRYSTKLPICSVVPPRCSYTLTVTTRKNQHPPPDNDEYFTLHTFMIGEHDLRDVDQGSVVIEYDYVFKKAKEMGRDEVQEVMLPVTCDPPAEGTRSGPTQSTVEIIAMPNSQQVSSIDVHVSEPWIMTTHHGGSLRVWNYEDMAMLTSIEVTDEPVQAAKFIAREKWIIAGDDNGYIHVHNYHVNKGVTSFDAHDGSIACLALHPTQPFLLSSSYYGYLIKLWDWEKDWACTRTFQGHANRVTQITFNPNDPGSFVSASADGRVMIWRVHSEAHGITTLDGHVEGQLCVDYFTRPDGQHLVVGTMDGTARIWDLKMGECIEKLEGHAGRITAVNLHPELPLLITGSLDGTIRLWSSTTYKLENIIGFNLGEVYAFGFIEGLRRMVVGCQQGIAMMDVSLL